MASLVFIIGFELGDWDWWDVLVGFAAASYAFVFHLRLRDQKDCEHLAGISRVLVTGFVGAIGFGGACSVVAGALRWQQSDSRDDIYLPLLMAVAGIAYAVVMSRLRPVASSNP